MLDFLISCDVSTLNCSADDISKEIETFANSYVRVSDSIWLFKYPSGFHGSFLAPEEHLFIDHFEKFTHSESTFILLQLKDRFYYNLPKSACSFLEQD